ncbi:unnamed protein product [Anisakis simplex]|uniref:Uncharacterized protein n=1 Tax=Anisakis simplex TaxID=6269 RepID=A0A0M3KAV3_ANISI|nr:unnamed protein product [Anisakis simplex]
MYSHLPSFLLLPTTLAPDIHESFRRVFRCEALRALIPLADCTSQAEKSDTPEIMNVALRAKCLVEDLLLPIYDN